MNCLIVDDDPLICDLLEHYCSKSAIIGSWLSTGSGFEAINLLSEEKFDLVLLDYNLNELTGEDIIKSVRGNTKVVMVTSNLEFGAKSYQYECVLDYLMKPIEYARFYKALKRVEGEAQTTASVDDNSIFVKDGNKLVKLYFSKIKYLKSEANYTSIVTANSKILTLMTMKKLEQQLPENFQRVHRSYIVNVDQIDSIEKMEINFNNDFVPISKSYLKEFHSKINLLD